MVKTIFIGIALLSCEIALGQESEYESESYFPLNKGISKTLTWYKSKYREVIKDTIVFEGKTYTQVAQVFPPDETINIYYRKSNDTIYYFNEVKKEDTPFFSINPVKGEKTSNGTVKKVGASLRTPNGKLTDLLVIEMEYSNGNKDTRYFKRGLGLVAVKNTNGLICWYVPEN